MNPTNNEIDRIMEAHREYEAQHAPVFDCCLCGETVKQFGHNARPVRDGKCCNQCNEHIIIPVRVTLIESIMDAKDKATEIKKTKKKTS